MHRIKNLNPLIIILFITIFNNLSFALLLPDTPDGKIGKNYQLYGFLATGKGISNKNFESDFFYNIGLRSNLGLDLLDFGLFYNIFSSLMGISADVKYGFIKSDDFSSCLNLSISKPFSDNWIIKTGVALNAKFIFLSELIFSTYLIYSFHEMQIDEISVPSYYSLYFYTGIEFQPPFLIDSTITLGCGYLYLPETPENNQNFFNNFYLNVFTRYAFNQPEIEKIDVSVNNIIKDKKQDEIINENIMIAKELIKIKEYKKAILILSDALYYYPDNFTLNLLLADCYHQAGDKIKAFIYYKKASEINTIDLKLKDFIKNLEQEIKK
jgi:tetratricopeptide (TPR) repeat protein